MEKKRLMEVFESLDENRKKTVEALIENAAFMRVTLREMQEEISRNGYMTEYQNGENQKGWKKSPAVEIHIAMTRNLAAVIRQLSELAPPAEVKESRLRALMDE